MNKLYEPIDQVQAEKAGVRSVEVVLLLGALALVSAYYIQDEDAGGNPGLSEAEGMLLRKRRDAEPVRSLKGRRRGSKKDADENNQPNKERKKSPKKRAHKKGPKKAPKKGQKKEDGGRKQ